MATREKNAAIGEGVTVAVVVFSKRVKLINRHDTSTKWCVFEDAMPLFIHQILYYEVIIIVVRSS